MFFCYKITNLLNGKVYIGKTNRPHERWIEHRNSNKNYPLSAEKIRSEYKAGGASHTKLAIKYNVSQANIGFIINNKIWRK